MNPPRPNVILVLADQLNANWLGCYGHDQAITPNLDAFAASGMQFTAAYCQNPICTPSRVSIHSGQYCTNHGYYGLSGPAPRLGNLFRHFHGNGYRTAAYGKLHLPESPRNWIADDVDEFGDSYETADGVCGRSEFLLGLKNKGLRDLEDSWHNNKAYGPGTISIDAMPSLLPLEETQEMWVLKKAINFIQESSETPFCVELAFQKPHHPLLPNEHFWNLYPEDLSLPEGWDAPTEGRPPHFRKCRERWRDYQPEFGKSGDTFEDFLRRSWRGTLACISQIDYVFGQLLNFLRENDLEKNTIVVFGSDHGAYHGLFGIMEKAPGICSEAVCRVPMLWRAPGVTPSGSQSDAFVENVDIAPTLSDLCGLPPFESADGLDISPLLKGDTKPVRTLAITENVWSKSIRWRNWRFVHYQREMFDAEDIGELYDLENDPQETRNLYYTAAHAQVVEACRRLLLEWLIRHRRTVTTQVTLKNNPGTDHDEGARFTYPLCEDGTAPNFAQISHRSEKFEMYL